MEISDKVLQEQSRKATFREVAARQGRIVWSN